MPCPIRNRPILETQLIHFQKVLSSGTVSTNIFLRRIHNFAIDMYELIFLVPPIAAIGYSLLYLILGGGLGGAFLIFIIAKIFGK